MKRSPVNKYNSARSFNRDVGRTMRLNLFTPLRGGWRC